MVKRIFTSSHDSVFLSQTAFHSTGHTGCVVVLVAWLYWLHGCTGRIGCMVVLVALVVLVAWLYWLHGCTGCTVVLVALVA